MVRVNKVNRVLFAKFELTTKTRERANSFCSGFWLLQQSSNCSEFGLGLVKLPKYVSVIARSTQEKENARNRRA